MGIFFVYEDADLAVYSQNEGFCVCFTTVNSISEMSQN